MKLRLTTLNDNTAGRWDMADEWGLSILGQTSTNRWVGHTFGVTTPSK